MRTITLTTDHPSRFPGYMVVGPSEDGGTRLRYESKTIDSHAARYLRMMELERRDPSVRIEISEVK